MLTECHTNDGPIIQINLIHEVMNLCATNETLMIAIDNICVLMDRVFVMGEISNDTLINFAILQSYPNYQEIQLDIQWLLRTVIKTVPVTCSEIHAIVQEHVDLMSDMNSGTPTSITLVACSTPKNIKSQMTNYCTRCKQPGHTHLYCIQEGGGMARKTIEESKV